MRVRSANLAATRAVFLAGTGLSAPVAAAAAGAAASSGLGASSSSAGGGSSAPLSPDDD